MSGGKATAARLAVPLTGAFAANADDTAQETPSVLDEAVADAVKATASTDVAVGELDSEPAAQKQEPAARKPAATARRRKPVRVPMPERVAKDDKGVPLQVKIPKALHWELKVHTTQQGSDMTRVTTALLSVYTQDPELVEALIDQAAADGVPLGELLHDALIDVAAQ